MFLPFSLLTTTLHKIQKYSTNTITITNPAAAFTYIDFIFKYVASFLYFCDNMERFWAFVSNSVRKSWKDYLIFSIIFVL